MPSATPRAYADDISVTSKRASGIRGVVKLTAQFARLTGMKINAKKSHVWGTTRAMRIALSLVLPDGQHIPLHTEERYLGAFVSYGKKRGKTRLSRVLKQCQQLCSRIQMTRNH